MLKLILTITAMAIFTTSSFAANFVCTGSKNGTRVKITGHLPGLSFGSTSATIYVDNREVMDIESGQLDVSLIRKKFLGRNHRGEVLEGSVTSMGSKTAIITRLVVPGHGIYLKNVPVKCK